MHYLTLEQIDSIIKKCHYVCFNLLYLTSSFSKPIAARKYQPPDTLAKKETTDEMVDRCINALHSTLEDYKKIPGVIFRITFKEYSNDSYFGPHDFILPDQVPAIPSQHNENVTGLGGLGMTELRSMIAIESKAALNDYRETLLLERERELKEEIEEFEKLKINPAAANISKGVGLALTKFFNAIVPDEEEVALSGQETEATKEAELLANDLIDSGLSASEIKEIHRIIKENKVKEQ